MSHMYLPWGSGSSRYSNTLQVRNQFASSLDLHDYEYQQNSVQRQRSPSLPPIRNCEQTVPKEQSRTTLNRNLSSAKRFSFYDEDGEGDTSGYGSETVNISRRNALQDINSNPVVAWQQESTDNRTKHLSEDMPSNDGRWSSRSPRTASEEGRPRWGDRGVATGRLWEPTAPNARLPQMLNQKKGTPAWVERELHMIENSPEILVIDQHRVSTSGLDYDRTSCNGSDEGRTYLRGQNVPLEPEVKALRENKRIKALELQSAILTQLEDQEKRRQEERERKLKEEKLEELRIQREQEEDRIKYEEERRKLEERQLLEHKKLETLKKALEVAEKKAKQEKEKRFTKYKINVNKNTAVEDKPLSSRCESTVNIPNANSDADKLNESLRNTDSPTKSNRTYNVHSAKSQTNHPNNGSRQNTDFNSPRSVGTGNLNFYIQNVPLQENQYSIVPLGINSDILNSQQNGLQLAVLVPQNLNNNMYSLSLNSLNNTEYVENSTKVLTPRKFRNSRNYKDAATQTDSIFLKYTIDRANETEEHERSISNDYQNIDENAPQESNHNTFKKERRLRSEEKFKKEIENRPKWGVNRPAAQYKKQSEKDPFYSQKRKIRQKHRPQARQYLSQSSDDSRSPSPPLRSEKTDVKQRYSVTQSYWRNKRSSQDLSKPNNDFAEDISLQTVFNQIGQVTLNDITEKKSPTSNNLSPSKRLTLSQKFINDKYGNRKLWNDDVVTDRNVKSVSLDVENRKKIIEQLNIAKREYLEKFEDQDTSKL